MANEERNALAELAERLKFDIDELKGKHRDHLGIYQCVVDDVIKASRIVSELAKVECQQIGVYHTRSQTQCTCGYRGAWCDSSDEAIAWHNRMARAVIKDVHGPRGL